MTRYAAHTRVPWQVSRAEIERTLARYGASGFMYGWMETSAVVAFHMADRNIKFVLSMPSPRDRAFTHTERYGTERSPAQAESAYDQAVRQRWRALALVIKAKLEAVESGIAEFEDEFLAQIVMPDGRTISDHVRPKIAIAYESGTVPPLIAGPVGEMQT